MHKTVWKYIVNTVYLLHVSAILVAIIREVRYKGEMHQDTKKL